MAFLEKDDYRFSVNLEVLDAITAGDDSIIDELSEVAVKQMKSFLSTRYDVALIFDVDGGDRDKTIMMYCKDIALYHIFSIQNFRPIPEMRKTRYEAALKWLQDVNQQTINPYGLPLNNGSLVKTGGNEKRINHLQ